MAQDVTLDEMASENDRLIEGYDLPAAGSVKAGTFENAILGQYAMAAYRVGEEYEHAQLYDGARKWYERALSIDPTAGPPRWRLDQMPAR